VKDRGAKSPQRGAGFLSEFREFVNFLRILWGLLAEIFAFFPLSGVFLKVIPLRAYSDDGEFNHLAPPLITAVATVVTLFVVLSPFGRRDEYQGQGRYMARRRLDCYPT
jgi:hypothetical protein